MARPPGWLARLDGSLAGTARLPGWSAAGTVRPCGGVVRLDRLIRQGGPVGAGGRVTTPAGQLRRDAPGRWPSSPAGPPGRLARESRPSAWMVGRRDGPPAWRGCPPGSADPAGWSCRGGSAGSYSGGLAPSGRARAAARIASLPAWWLARENRPPAWMPGGQEDPPAWTTRPPGRPARLDDPPAWTVGPSGWSARHGGPLVTMVRSREPLACLDGRPPERSARQDGPPGHGGSAVRIGWHRQGVLSGRFRGGGQAVVTVWKASA